LDGGTTCACSRRRSLREPDAGNPHVRFDEGRGALSATSPTLPQPGVADINSDVGATRASAMALITGLGGRANTYKAMHGAPG
ncbi:MAG: hypothetical protein ABSH01_27285, partial [Terriglobia bacterium]